MVKKLDKLILGSFIGPFIVTFFISFFVLMMQTLWKYIDDLVGKGLDFVTIMKFVLYSSATLSSLAMPIAILISSIMTFGNLGESFELVAVKSSGISLLRIMRPLIWFTLGLCIITFLFANYVMPYSQLKFVTLYKEILIKKPALNIKQGSFYTDIPQYAIKIGKKEPNSKNIEKVLIYDQTNQLQENTIMADSGKMEVTKDNFYLAFNLKNGNRYQERIATNDTATEYIRLEFKTFKKLFDLSTFQANKGDESLFKNSPKMLTANQIGSRLDSLTKRNDSINVTIAKNLVIALPYLNDTSKKWGTTKAKPYNKKDNIFPDSANMTIIDRALSKANELKNTLEYSSIESSKRSEDILYHKLEWQRKYSFSLACMVLLFIGAPLGSIIRKGGMGMPLVVAIIFFLIFHLFNMFGEKFVKTEALTPFIGMWLSVFILTPVGIFLTYKAMNDSQLFNKEFYNRIAKKIKPFLPKKRLFTYEQVLKAENFLKKLNKKNM
jgi:lipopolysaccharide export system permease protein